jgi:hypothetical protein
MQDRSGASALSLARDKGSKPMVELLSAGPAVAAPAK